MIRSVIVFLIVIGISLPVLGQTFLVLEKMGTKKRFEYQLGDMMGVQLNDDDFFTRISILDFADSAIITENETIDFSSIRAVQLDKEAGFLKVSGPILVVAGATLFAIDIINQSIVQGGGYEFSPGVAAVSASMIGVGTAFTFGGRDKVKLKKWWRLRVVRI